MGMSFSKCCDRVRSKNPKKTIKNQNPSPEHTDASNVEEDYTADPSSPPQKEKLECSNISPNQFDNKDNLGSLNEITQINLIKDSKNKNNQKSKKLSNITNIPKPLEASPKSNMSPRQFDVLSKRSKISQSQISYFESCRETKTRKESFDTKSMVDSNDDNSKMNLHNVGVGETKKSLFNQNLQPVPTLNNSIDYSSELAQNFWVQIYIESVDISYKQCDDFSYSFKPYVEVLMQNNPVKEYQIMLLDEEKQSNSDNESSFIQKTMGTSKVSDKSFYERASIYNSPILGHQGFQGNTRNNSIINNSYNNIDVFGNQVLNLSPVKRSTMRFTDKKDKIFSFKSVK